MEVLTNFAIFAGPLMMIALIASALIIRPYPIDQAEHARILRAIHDMKVEGA
jgi:Na+/melibiose symporter-like transporter